MVPMMELIKVQLLQRNNKSNGCKFKTSSSSGLKEVSKSYKEAKLALDVGKIFFNEKDVIAYSTLGIGRLIYQLPIPLCKMFIREIFEGKSPDDFDEETLITINKFFENSLNVSETSRQLTFTVIRWCTDWIRFKRAQDLICVSLRMPLHLRLR